MKEAAAEVGVYQVEERLNSVYNSVQPIVVRICFRFPFFYVMKVLKTPLLSKKMAKVAVTAPVAIILAHFVEPFGQCPLDEKPRQAVCIDQHRLVTKGQ